VYENRKACGGLTGENIIFFRKERGLDSGVKMLIEVIVQRAVFSSNITFNIALFLLNLLFNSGLSPAPLHPRDGEGFGVR